MKKYLILMLIFLFGCNFTPRNELEPYYKSKFIEDGLYIPYSEGNFVKVIESLNIKKTSKKYEKQGFILLGSANYNGRWVNRGSIVDLAKKIGATLVIVQSSNPKHEILSWIDVVETPHTIHHKGSISGMSSTHGNINNQYGYNLGSFDSYTSSYGEYSGESTYYTTDYVTRFMTYTTYKQYVLFYAKENKQ